jgi:predicted DNA-binding transcriptional regulator YafY
MMHNQNKILRVLQMISLLKKEPAKSIRFLSGILESTDRTVYRYLDLVKELGFEVQKEPNNKFLIIGNGDFETVSFSNEEAALLRDLVLSTGKGSKLKDALLQKIYLQSELALQGNHILKANLGKMANIINRAIKANKRVVLKSYHSINSLKITDRTIEPICFTDNYHSICGFEVDSKTNKFYNLERITEVILLNDQQAFQQLHQLEATDAFGFSKLNGKWFLVELKLTLKAYVLLKEEYPKIAKHLKKDKKADGYILKIEVNNPKPIVRFILGLKEDVEVMGSAEFKKYLNELALATS